MGTPPNVRLRELLEQEGRVVEFSEMIRCPRADYSGADYDVVVHFAIWIRKSDFENTAKLENKTGFLAAKAKGPCFQNKYRMYASDATWPADCLYQCLHVRAFVYDFEKETG